jgi:hypothetical protein
MSGNASEIVLRGKKTKNTIRLTPLAEADWEQYRTDALAMKDAFGAPAYAIMVDGRELTSIRKPSPAFNRFVITYEEEGEEEGESESVTVNMAYVTTPTGIRFYEPLTIDGITAQDFTFNAASRQMVSTEGSVVITQVFPPLEDVFVNSLSSTKWFLSSGAMGSGFLPSFNTMKSGLGGIDEVLFNAWIGPSVQNSVPSFSYYSYAPGDGYYYAGSNLLNVTTGVEGRIAIEVTAVYEANGKWYADNVPTLRQFTVLLGGEYNITTTDPPTNITSVTLTDPANATKTLTLTLEEVALP